MGVMITMMITIIMMIMIYNTLKWQKIAMSQLKDSIWSCDEITILLAAQCIAVHHSVVQCSAGQFKTVQFNTIQYNTTQYITSALRITWQGLIPSPMSSVLGSRARNACISPRIAVPVNPANRARASRSWGSRLILMQVKMLMMYDWCNIDYCQASLNGLFVIQYCASVAWQCLMSYVPSCLPYFLVLPYGPNRLSERSSSSISSFFPPSCLSHPNSEIVVILQCYLNDEYFWFSNLPGNFDINFAWKLTGWPQP